MSYIPGGRQRASSEGDILDDGFCGTLFLNGKKSSADTCHGNNQNKHNSTGIGFTDTEEHFDSDGECSLQSHNSSVSSRNRANKSIFKSMRKAVSRRFVKENLSKPVGSVANSKKTLKSVDLAKIWTPDLRHLGLSLHYDLNGTQKATMSTSRPLITDPSVGMTIPRWKRTPGLVGIYNHGNSCFMNTVLQCLSNADSFTEYFVKELYRTDLKNSKNGKKIVFRSAQGEVTEKLGELLKSIWSGKYNSEISKEFKNIVGKFSSQYKGDHQHDAQEFLLWLLDRVHEDVCTYPKKKQKAHKTLTQTSNRSEEEAAGEAASVKGESFVVRLFQALHASTLTCPTCGRRSSTLAPDLCVSLPLPQSCPRVMSLVLVPFDSGGEAVSRTTSRLNRGGIRVAVTLNQYDTVGELKTRICAEVATTLSVKPRRLILVQLREDGFGATYSNEQPVSDIGDCESLYALEASKSAGDNDSDNEVGVDDPTNNGAPMAHVMVVHVETSSSSSRCYRFGSAGMLRVRRDITWKGLQKEILMKMGKSILDVILTQKLSTLFSLRVYDGSSRRNSLSSDIELPLYTQDVERAYVTLDEDFGPLHIKLIAEWDSTTKKTIVTDSKEYIEQHRSVRDAPSSPLGQGRVSLDECFKLYTQEEKLIGEDAWVCPHCKLHQQGTIKTLGLWSLPDILVLHLKRFKQTGLRRSKLNTLVDFPVEGLDMSPYLSRRRRDGESVDMNTDSPNSESMRPDDHTYDLIGVSNHYGNMMGGHYTAVCRSSVDGEWREYNDQHVRLLTPGEPVATREAYLLFYQRRSLGKDINQRFHTGDHWAFSLPLAPTELGADGSSASSSGGSTPRGEVIPPFSSQTSALTSSSALGHPRRRSQPRSVSPSLRRSGGARDPGGRRSASSSRPLTPQPHRRPTTLTTADDNRYSDSNDSNDENKENVGSGCSPLTPTNNAGSPRRSRPVQRQVSEPGPRRIKSKDPPIRSEKHGQAEGERGKDRSLGTEKYGKKWTVSLPKQDADKGKIRGVDISSRSSGHSQLPHSSSIESDSRHPSLYDDDSLPLSSERRFLSHGPLQVRLEDRDGGQTSHSLPASINQEILNVETARKKLAQRIDLEKIEDLRTQPKVLGSRQNGRLYNSQKSYELAKHNIIGDDFDFSTLRSARSNTNGHHHTSLDFDRSKAEDQGRWDDNLNNNNISNSKHFHSNGLSRLDSDVEEEEEEEDDEVDERRSTAESRFPTNFELLAEHHFGSRPYNKEKYSSAVAKEKDFSNPVSGNLRLSNGRDLPRSSTDHSIQYTLTTQDLPAPPSPTPPRSLVEEQRMLGRKENDSHIITSTFHIPSSNRRELAAMLAYQHAGKRGRIYDHEGSRTLPGYASDSGARDAKHNFRPPRGTWGLYRGKDIRTSPASGGSVPTPCLRESSV